MFKQIILPILACIVFIVAVGIFTRGLDNGKLNFFQLKASASPKNTTAIEIKGNGLRVELASTEKERQKGLSGRSSLDENGGMLFIFDQKNVTPSFWMKDMQIPLDIIWIKDGKILKIDKNVPAEPDTPDDKLKIYSPGSPIDYVLEVNSGYSDKNGLQVGDPANISL